MEIKRRKSAEVIDITPLECPKCGETADPEDAFCGDCGYDLLQELPILCPTCGKAAATNQFFCRTCGTSLVADTAEHSEAVTAPLDAARVEEVSGRQPSRPRRGYGRAMKVAVGLLAVVAIGIASWYLLRGPDLAPYDEGMRAISAWAEDLQGSANDVTGPEDLASLSESIGDSADDLSDIENEVGDLDAPEHHAALLALIAAETNLLEEVQRLSELPSADVNANELVEVEDLSEEVVSTFAAALDLRQPDPTPASPTFDETPLTSALLDLAEYRKEVIRERARITKANKRRAGELETLKAFTGDVDGIVERYSTARAELSNWITTTDAGRTWQEAYQVLDQGSSQRAQLRDELASLEAPSAFTSVRSDLLAIMDRAVEAMGAASRGMAEFQYDWSYWHYTETPGWQEFEQATDEITSSYNSSLNTYEELKSELTKRLSKQTPPPELPD